MIYLVGSIRAARHWLHDSGLDTPIRLDGRDPRFRLVTHPKDASGLAPQADDAIIALHDADRHALRELRTRVRP